MSHPTSGRIGVLLLAAWLPATSVAGQGSGTPELQVEHQGSDVEVLLDGTSVLTSDVARGSWRGALSGLEGTGAHTLTVLWTPRTGERPPLQVRVIRRGSSAPVRADTLVSWRSPRPVRPGKTWKREFRFGGGSPDAADPDPEPPPGAVPRPGAGSRREDARRQP